jgi:hypothetical protein
MYASEFLESENVIKANLVLARYRTLCFVSFFMAIAMLALIIVSILIDDIFNGGQHFSHSTALSVPIFWLILSTCNLILGILQVRYWEGIERRRFVVIRGDQLFLADEQPTPDASLLPLPTTIITPRRGKKAFLLIMGMTLLMAMFFAGWFTWFDSNPLLLVADHLLNFLALSAIGFVAASILFFAILFSPLARQQVKVTEGGLAAREGMEKTHTVMWHEVRLYAMYGTFGRQKSGTSITYELSSARNIVRWTWFLRKTSWVDLGSTISHDEYNRQMHALLSLVAAKTGLPLYDLREDLPKGEPKD